MNLPLVFLLSKKFHPWTSTIAWSPPTKRLEFYPRFFFISQAPHLRTAMASFQLFPHHLLRETLLFHTLFCWSQVLLIYCPLFIHQPAVCISLDSPLIWGHPSSLKMVPVLLIFSWGRSSVVVELLVWHKKVTEPPPSLVPCSSLPQARNWMPLKVSHFPFLFVPALIFSRHCAVLLAADFLLE